MEVLKELLFKVFVPMVWLSFFAYVFANTGIKLAKAWKTKDHKQLWLHLWILLVSVYFLIHGG